MIMLTITIPSSSANLNSRRTNGQLGGRCTIQEREEFDRCQPDARYDWDIQETDYFTDTRKFCCFVWDTLNCEVDIAERCDSNYAAQLSYETEQAYGAMCEYYYRHSPLCFFRWWSALLVVVALISIIVLIVFIIYRKKQSKFSREYTTERNYY
ncbi:hypothetical protein DERF_006075 [Dermatophagoides farinae]|uniref:Uncharacterized protein n=2 Tax=Dermatophagoides farinae TaxID=6954 RepID=A0A922I9M0_DERFA|nr:hypothetical protein HUG17_3084 [Dermatophagoides farinae]KAH9522509.1 hypothetical protein DERF_006075 [Dermatophagoides farinae]